MKNITHRILLLITCLGIANISCSKSETVAGKPTIELISGNGLITRDTSATEASTLSFRVYCKWNGEDELTNLIVSRNGGRVVDGGMYVKEFQKDISFAKTSEKFDSIAFIIRDIKGESATTSLKVEKKAGSSGDLVRYNNITLNAQNAINGKSFMSMSNGLTYTLQDAFGVQLSINLLYYYDVVSTDGNTISSPGANIDPSIFTGTYGLSNWTTANKNTTRFIKLSLTQQQFDTISNPVYIVNAYGSTVGYRKAKNLVLGDTFSFLVENTGKYGIFRVSNVTGEDAGNVVFSIVMQK